MASFNTYYFQKQLLFQNDAYLIGKQKNFEI